MEKKDRLPKPLMECEVLPSLHKERSERKRGTVPSEKEEEERILALKDWSHYSYIRHHNELWKQDRIYLTQQTALSELKKESSELYEHAISMDPDLIPFSFQGPVATPPIQGYLQDGEYKETTQTFKVIYEDTEAFLKTLLAKQRKKKKKTEDED